MKSSVMRKSHASRPVETFRGVLEHPEHPPGYYNRLPSVSSFKKALISKHLKEWILDVGRVRATASAIRKLVSFTEAEQLALQNLARMEVRNLKCKLENKKFFELKSKEYKDGIKRKETR